MLSTMSKKLKTYGVTNMRFKGLRRVSLLVGAVITLLFTSFQPYVSAAPRPGDNRDCSGSRIFGRCYKEGYATGSEDNDTKAFLFPIEPRHVYTDNCSPISQTIPIWSFPAVACNSTRNAAYTESFINDTYSHLVNYREPVDPITISIGTYYETLPAILYRDGVASAMYVNTMLGVQGPTIGNIEWSGACAYGNWWTECYRKAMGNNVIRALSRFNEWADIIRLYDQQGLINWNGYESYTAGTANSGGMNYGTDVGWHRMTTSGEKHNMILFNAPDGRRIYGINRDCGNLVGELEPLPVDKTLSLVPVAQTPTLDDESLGNATFDGNRVNVSIRVTVPFIRDVRITKIYFVDKYDGDDSTIDRDIILNTVGQTFTDNVPLSGYPIPSESYALPSNLVAGDRVCSVIRVYPQSGTIDSTGRIVAPTGEAESLPACKRIVNKPYVTLFGSDVKVGGGREGALNCTDKAAGIGLFNRGTSQGSSAQLAIFALGAINGLVGTAYAVPPPGNPSIDMLTAPDFAYYNGCTHDFYADREDGAPWGGAITGAPNNKYYVNGDTTLTSGPLNIANNQKVFIYVDGDVTINHDITLAQGTWRDRSEIPSFYLVATGDILISNNVQRLGGVYVSQRGGSIVTCNEAKTAKGTTYIANANEMYSRCTNQLVVDGAFVSTNVVLNRAYGSLRNDGPGESPYAVANTICNTAVGNKVSKVCAAEVFRFNPSLYLAEAPRALAGSTGTNDKAESITNLPPIL